MRNPSNLSRKVLAMVLAGGRGSRLKTLTESRAKPAVPFGGKYRIIDFPMSNLENSGFRNIVVLPQYGSFELMIHLQHVWNSDPAHDFFVYPLFPQHIRHTEYQDTADAVEQNMSIIGKIGNFRTLAILSGDHVYSMDFSQMLSYHYDVGSKFTVSVLEMPSDSVSGLGVLEVDANMRIIGFQEKPKKDPKEIPGKPGYCLVSMGNYIAEREFLGEVFQEMSGKIEHALDFGKDVIPYLIEKGMDLFAYNFNDNVVSGAGGHYWRDVGTVDAYWQSHQDIISINPPFNIHNTEAWPIRTGSDNLPGAKLIGINVPHDRACLVGGKSILQRCMVEDSILGRRVEIYDRAEVSRSILFDGVVIGAGSRIENAIVDQETAVPPGTHIGVDRKADEARGFHVSASGIVIIPSGFRF